MKRIMDSLFNLRPGERSLVLWMAAYHFVLLVTLYLLKPVRDSLFLSEVGAAELPVVFMLVAVAVVPVSMLYDRAGRAVRLGRLVYGITLFLALNLVVLRLLVGTGAAWASFVLYVWVSIYGVLVTAQFWLMAGAVFDAAQAKRIFALLSVGAILGAVVGGEITGLLVEEAGVRTENLLLVAAGLLAGTAAMVVRIRQKTDAPADAANAPAEAAKTAGIGPVLRGSRHLQLIIGVIALTVITTTIVDFQFKTVAAAAFPAEADLTAFMGRFYGRVSLVALLLQLLFGSKLLQRIGVGGAVLALPLGLAAASVGLLAAPGLVAATLLRGTDQSLKHSIDKTGRELLFVPVPLAARKRVKVFIDLFVDQGAQGLAGALLLLLTAGLGFGVRGLAVVTLALLAAWAALALAARGSYVHQFRRLLRRRTGVGDEDDATPATMQDFMGALTRSTGHTLATHLERFENEGEAVPAEALRQLIEHEAASVRRRAIRLLRLQENGAFLEPVAPYLGDSDGEVRLEAARYIYQYLPEDIDRLPALQEGLEHGDMRIRAAGLGLITKDGGAAERALVTEELLWELLAYEGEAEDEVRSEVARVLGVLEDRPFQIDMLGRLLHDASPPVVRHAIESAGYSGERDFVPRLLKLMQQEAYRSEARRALAVYGERVLGTLYDHLVDDRASLDVRTSIPGILAARPAQASADVLLISLERAAAVVRSEIVRALSTLRASDGNLKFNEEWLQDVLMEEVRCYGALGQCLGALRETDGAQLLTEPIRDARGETLERVFRLLGLRHRPRDLHSAYEGLVSDDRALRAGAVEFLDNLLDYDTKRKLLPLLDDADGERALREMPELFGIAIRTPSQALIHLVGSDDPRLATVALRHAAAADTPEGTALVEEAADHASATVRAEAQRVLSRAALPEKFGSA